MEWRQGDHPQYEQYEQYGLGPIYRGNNVVVKAVSTDARWQAGACDRRHKRQGGGGASSKSGRSKGVRGSGVRVGAVRWTCAHVGAGRGSGLGRAQEGGAVSLLRISRLGDECRSSTSCAPHSFKHVDLFYGHKSVLFKQEALEDDAGGTRAQPLHDPDVTL